MKHPQLLVLALCLLATLNVPGAVRYVDINSANPTPPYTSWATAATNIQDAVDAALAGDEVLVTNGVYRTGGKRLDQFRNNRVVIDKPLTVHSVNGPQFTMIEGASGTRCAFLQNGAFLAGFTLTNGILRQGLGAGGGVFFSTSPSDAVVSNCVIIDCIAIAGGGAAAATPGSIGGTFVNCTFANNRATGVVAPFPFDQRAYGGAVSSCRLVNCTLTNNGISLEAPVGGVGGGAYRSVLENCLLVGNSSSIPWSQGPGGGAAFSSLVNCTVLQNTGGLGGGVYMCSVTNSIVYDNTGGNHASNNFVAWSCTTPMPEDGIGNITNEPLFADPASGNFRLQLNSPGIDAGNNSYVASPVDLDGKERIVGGTVDMGAYEWIAVPTHYVSLTSPNPTPPYLSWSTAATNIQDAVDAAFAGDQILVTNGVYQAGGRAYLGLTNRVFVSKPLSIQSVNGPELTTIQGYQVPATTIGKEAVRCVYLRSGARISGFTLTRGATLGFAGGFDAYATSGGGVLCESPSEVVSNCVIMGNAAAYCGGGAFSGTIVDCLLANNEAPEGGGVCLATVNNSWLIGNLARSGGGADASTLNNCILTGNTADGFVRGGGGATGGQLINCTVTGNTATGGGPGGVDSYLLDNCIVYYNNAASGAHNFNSFDVTWRNCCTFPLPSGSGNITNAPLFVDTNGWANLRLRSNSPCINAGSNASVVGSVDLDGRPRIVGGTVDMGAYEFQTGVSGEFIGWLSQFGLPTDGSADHADGDSDQLNNWQEWNSGTVPTDASSVLRLLNPVSNNLGLAVSWQSVTNRTYFLERASSLGTQPSFSSLASNIIGQPGTTSYTDTNAIGASPFFYRVRVQP